MAIIRIHIGLTPAQVRRLDKLAAKWEVNRTEAMKRCLREAAERENLK